MDKDAKSPATRLVQYPGLNQSLNSKEPEQLALLAEMDALREQLDAIVDSTAVLREIREENPQFTRNC